MQGAPHRRSTRALVVQWSHALVFGVTSVSLAHVLPSLPPPYRLQERPERLGRRTAPLIVPRRQCWRHTMASSPSADQTEERPAWDADSPRSTDDASARSDATGDEEGSQEARQSSDGEQSDAESSDEDDDLFAFEGVLYLRAGSGKVKETESGDEETVGRWCETTQTVVFDSESAELAHRQHDDYRPTKKQRSTTDTAPTTHSGTGALLRVHSSDLGDQHIFPRAEQGHLDDVGEAQVVVG